MVDPLQPENPGLLSSVLDWISLPGYGVRNILKGNLVGTGKNLLDFGGDIIDSVLPGDWIPRLSEQEDRPDFSDLTGGMEPGFGKFAVDLVGNTLTDPLTYLTFGASAGAGMAGKATMRAGIPFTKAAVSIPGSARALEAGGNVVNDAMRRGRAAFPEAADALANAKIKTKAALGWLAPSSPEAAAALSAGENARSLYGKNALVGAENVFRGVDEDLAQLGDQVIGNYQTYTPSGFNSYLGPAYEKLLPGSETLSVDRQLADALAQRGAQETGSLVPNITPESDYLKVKNAGAYRSPNDLEKGVGIGGVASPSLEGDVLDLVTKNPDRMGDQVFNPMWADQAAGKAYDNLALNPTDPRFASGIDVANQRMTSPGIGNRGIKTFGPDKEPVIREPATTRRTTDPLTGAVTETPIIRRQTVDLPASNTDAVNSLMGAGSPTMESVAAGELGRTSKPMIKVEDQLAQWMNRIDALPASDAQKDRLRDFLPKYLEFTHNNFMEKTKDLGALKPGIGDDVTTMIPQDYAHRMLSGMPTDEERALTGAGANSLKERTLKDNQDFIDFMNASRGQGVTHEADLAKSTVNLASQEGRIAQRSAMAKSLLGDKFTSLNDPEVTSGVIDRIAALRASGDTEGAYLLKSAWEGLPARGAFMQKLAEANRIFKPAAVAGVGVPNVGGIMKNILAFPSQFALQGEWKQAFEQAKQTPKTIWAAAAKYAEKAFGLKGIETDSSILDQAFRQAGGRTSNAIDWLTKNGHENLALLAKNGVADGYISKEAVEDSLRNSSWGKRLMASVGIGANKQGRAMDFIDAPGEAFQAGEQFARIGGAKRIMQDLVSKGMPKEQAAVQAAERVQGALYSYAIATPENRALRDILPFAAFQTNAIRQSGKFLAKNPAAAVVASELMGPGDSQDPLYPYMEGKTNIPLGADEQGNQTYLTNLGTPLEALNSLPNPSANLLDFGRDIERKVVGSSQPLLKSVFGITAGEDPFFETPYGTYSKVAGQDMGEFGRAFNLAAGTGLLTPLSSPVSKLAKFADDKGTIGSDLADFLTGANAVSVDEDKAVQQQLQAILERNPEVQKFTTLYQNSPDPQTQALLQALREAKARVKQKKLAAQSNG